MELPIPEKQPAPPSDAFLDDLNKARHFDGPRAYVPYITAWGRIVGCDNKCDLPEILSYLFHPDPRVVTALFSSNSILWSLGQVENRTLYSRVARDVKENGNKWTEMLDMYVKNFGLLPVLSEDSVVEGHWRQKLGDMVFDDIGAVVPAGPDTLQPAVLTVLQWLAGDPDDEDILATLRQSSSWELRGIIARNIRRVSLGPLRVLIAYPTGYDDLCKNPHLNSEDRAMVSSVLAQELLDHMSGETDAGPPSVAVSAEAWANMTLGPDIAGRFLKALSLAKNDVVKTYLTPAFKALSGGLCRDVVLDILMAFRPADNDSEYVEFWRFESLIRDGAIDPSMYLPLVECHRRPALLRAIATLPGLTECEGVRRALSTSTIPEICQLLLPYAANRVEVVSLWERSIKDTERVKGGVALLNLATFPVSEALMHLPLEVLSKPFVRPSGPTGGMERDARESEYLWESMEYLGILRCLIAERMGGLDRVDAAACSEYALGIESHLRALFPEIKDLALHHAQTYGDEAPSDDEIHRRAARIFLYLLEVHPSLRKYFSVWDTRNMLLSEDPKVRRMLFQKLSSLPRNKASGEAIFPRQQGQVGNRRA